MWSASFLYDCGVIILEHSGACLFLCGNVDGVECAD